MNASGDDRNVCTVAVDVGNTAVKLCVRQSGDLVDHSIQIDQGRWHHAAIDWVRDRLGCQCTFWRIASVHRRAAGRLIESLGEDLPDASINLVTYRDVPMDVCVDQPDVLGIDRLLSAYAATQIQAAQDHAGPLVVVDAGSAVTVDLVDAEGSFRGGAILPGLNLQARALATGTDALPQIQWQSHGDVKTPATNTADAIHAGILIGVASAIDGLAEKYLRNFRIVEPTSPRLILTGGDSLALSPHVRTPHVQRPNLVCRGLLNLPHLAPASIETA